MTRRFHARFLQVWSGKDCDIQGVHAGRALGIGVGVSILCGRESRRQWVLRFDGLVLLASGMKWLWGKRERGRDGEREGERRERDIRLRALCPARPHAVSYTGGCDQEEGVIESPCGGGGEGVQQLDDRRRADEVMPGQIVCV